MAVCLPRGVLALLEMGGQQRERVPSPMGLLSMPEESELASASAGTNTVDGGHGRVDKPQLLLLINTELVPASLAPGQRPQAQIGRAHV